MESAGVNAASEGAPGAAFSPDDPEMAAALLGEGLPAEAEQHLRAASLSYAHSEVAESHLREAQVLAPDHAAVLIGLYRFYFYKGRLRECLEVARVTLAKAAEQNRLAADWHQVRPADADFGSYAAAVPRFYLFTLKGYAYLQLRLGDVVEGREAVRKLLELDPTDKVGAKVLLQVLNRIGRPEDDE